MSSGGGPAKCGLLDNAVRVRQRGRSEACAYLKRPWMAWDRVGKGKQGNSDGGRRELAFVSVSARGGEESATGERGSKGSSGRDGDGDGDGEDERCNEVGAERRKNRLRMGGKRLTEKELKAQSANREARRSTTKFST
ncbi:hypothetical protein IAQ61_006899 [Plenodomus lingam]|uniref:uncharacterized protein n=1 Tax=Leptosphaeria maculans TaxID=5022 RepID=UPI00332BC01C|nr:hypothetical protein IAQ61_006899 [Plenodomus lingam]